MLALPLWLWVKLPASVSSSKNRNSSFSCTIIMQRQNTRHGASGTTLSTKHGFDDCYLHHYFIHWYSPKKTHYCYYCHRRKTNKNQNQFISRAYLRAEGESEQEDDTTMRPLFMFIKTDPGHYTACCVQIIESSPIDQINALSFLEILSFPVYLSFPERWRTAFLVSLSPNNKKR